MHETLFQKEKQKKFKVIFGYIREFEACLGFTRLFKHKRKNRFLSLVTSAHFNDYTMGKLLGSMYFKGRTRKISPGIEVLREREAMCWVDDVRGEAGCLEHGRKVALGRGGGLEP